jgi:hypothetical protein
VKRFAVLALVTALLGLFGCGQVPIAEETATEEPTIEEPEPAPKPVLYSYTEFDTILQPGCHSVNELAKHFGKPINFAGSIIANQGGPDGMVFALKVEFEGGTAELWDAWESGTKLSYNNEDYEDYPGRDLQPTEGDLALRLELYGFTVTGKSVPLPRGIHIGDSVEKVREAYPDGMNFNYYNKWDEAIIKQSNAYYPEWDYGVDYIFHDEILTQADVTWFNGWARFD